jgi:hypothetical protein
MRFIFGVRGIPGDLVDGPGVRRVHACSGGVFPFRFGGQAIPVSVVGGVQLGDKCLGFELAYGFNRTVVSFDAARIRLHQGGPLSLGDFVLPDLKALRDLDAMPGTLVGIAEVVARGATHHELTGWDFDEFHARCFRDRPILCTQAVAECRNDCEGSTNEDRYPLFHESSPMDEAYSSLFIRGEFSESVC